MKFLDNIGSYSFIILALSVVIAFRNLEMLTFVWLFALASLAGAIIGLVRHKSKHEIVFGVLTILFFVGVIVILIGAAATFHD